MKKIICTVLSFALLGSFALSAGCGDKGGTVIDDDKHGGAKVGMQGTALAEALLASTRINHSHLSTSFDFMDNRLAEESQSVSTVSTRLSNEIRATNNAVLNTKKSEKSSKGEIISGSGDTAVYSWSAFEQLVRELSYFQSHFSAGQSNTARIEENITQLEYFTDLKGKWVEDASYYGLLMLVEENQEMIFMNDEVNDDYSVGIRSVNDEINTTYEYYENQGHLQIRTLATPNRRYEYSTVNGEEVMSFVADNDNGYWRLVQTYTYTGEELGLNVLIMTDALAYSFRYDIHKDYAYASDVILLSPDLKYEIAKVNYDQITVFPGSFTGIEELRVNAAEHKDNPGIGTDVGYTADYGYYSTYAPPHIHTAKGVIQAPNPTLTTFTALDENVSYTGGNVHGLWEYVYPELEFSVRGDSMYEKFENLHDALAKYGIEPIYDKDAVAEMMIDVYKLVDGFTGHYTWNGKPLDSYETAMQAYAIEKEKSAPFENAFTEAKKLPVATRGELLEMQQNANFPKLHFETNATASVENGLVRLTDLTASVDEDLILEENTNYLLKIALKKNTDELEELLVLDNLIDDSLVSYAGGKLTLSLNGEYQLPTDISEGEYDLVAYIATAEEGIRVSAFKRVACEGEVEDVYLSSGMSVYTTITAEKVLQSVYTCTFDLDLLLEQNGVAYTYAEVLNQMENKILEIGYFQAGAILERYDIDTQTATPVTVQASDETLETGTYRLAYLPQADVGDEVAYIYCKIIIA